jgi:hypothetical protein
MLVERRYLNPPYFRDTRQICPLRFDVRQSRKQQVRPFHDAPFGCGMMTD